MKKILAILFFFGCAIGAYFFGVEKAFVNPYPAVCNLVAQKIFLEDDPVKKWHRICLRRQRLVTPYSPRKLVIKDINNVLGLLNVSHLEVFDSAAVKSIWVGESKETGLETDFVDSELVVFKIHPNSPAEKVGFKKGDVLVTINGQQPNPWEARSESGLYVVQRHKEKMNIKIKTETIQRSEQITFSKFDKGLAIHIPSFQARFFSDEKLQEISDKMAGARRVIVDLRGNSGGNFVAGLRFLSTMICKPSEVGRLVRTRAEKKTSLEMPDDLRDEKQIEVLSGHYEVLLKTFPQKSCYRGELRVLVDGKSASVAEMVGQALKEFRQAKLLGNVSRGQLLVGVWYPLDEVGPGVQISIPEAYYISAQKHRIEGHGVDLDKVLYYDLDELQAGQDTWIKKALD